MKSVLSKIKKFYETKYKILLIIPFLIIILAFTQIFVQYSMTGDFVHKGVSLKGGSTITISEHFTESEIDTIETSLRENYPLADISIRKLAAAGTMTGIAIDSDAQENSEIESLTKTIEEVTEIDIENYSIEVTGSSLGSSFFKQTMIALLLAFLLMGIVVFIYFRNLIPSAAVILAALSDIVVSLAIFNLTGMKLGTAGIAAFLMLIGYSVDTDILLSTRVLKKKEGSVMDRIYSAMKTGLTMSATTVSAILIATIFVKSEIVKQIMIILLIGLIVDLIMTWIQNVGILRLYLEKKREKKHKMH